MSGIMALIAFAATAPLSVAVTPSMSSTGGTTATFTTPAVTATVTGGSGAYTYAWSMSATDGSHGFTPLSPAAATTAFRITFIVAGDGCAATAQLLVTDTGSGATATVQVEIFHRDTREAA